MTGAPGWNGPPAEPWRSGPWSLGIAGDELADVAFDARPVLRSIRAVVRDRDWRTVPPAVVGLETDGSGLRIGLRFAGLGADLRGDLVVTADGDRLTARLDLRCGTAFLRNRIGLVVLHTADVAGTALEVLHPDGTTTATRFPVSIAPHQPALEVVALSWEGDGVRARLAFEGDVFEMEDQRNWTDASFKTYSTPLAEPFPVLVDEGAVIRQAVVLAAATTGPAPAPEIAAPVVLTRTDRHLPTFSLGATTDPGPLRRADAGSLLIEVAPDRPGWREALARAADESADGSLDVRIVTDSPDAVREVVAALDGTAVVRIGVFGTRSHLTEPVTWAALRDAGPAAELVGGTRAHFTELNRGHEALPPDLPALSFASTPQMHAVEPRQLVESIDIQRLTALDAIRIADGRPVHIGPVTLKPRFNAVATSSQDETAAAAEATDPRQADPELAAWTVASGAALSVPGVASVSWFEAAGPRGIHGMPVRSAVLDLLALSGAEAVEASPAPRLVHVLAGVVEGGLVALVANLRAESVALTIGPADDLRDVDLAPFASRRLTWTL